MSKLSKSPERGTFQLNAYLERCAREGNEPDPEYVNQLKSWQLYIQDRIEDPDYQEDNLEHALRSTRWIVEKARASDRYAQNIYAALCNIQWQRIDVLPILKDEYWSCSWRSAGGIVADILGRGDYIDWYCSGIGEGLGNGDTTGTKGYVPEGHVTEEIEEDFKQLGWQWSTYE
jgi:hypothetical protein